MKYLLLISFLPLFSCAMQESTISTDYDEIHKPFFSMHCINEATQQEMDACGKKSLLSATNSMTLLVESLIESNRKYSPGFSKKINEAQIKWENFHRTSCEIETYESIGGSAYYSIFNTCLEMKVNERVSYLKWLADNI